MLSCPIYALAAAAVIISVVGAQAEDPDLLHQQSRLKTAEAVGDLVAWSALCDEKYVFSPIGREFAEKSSDPAIPGLALRLTLERSQYRGPSACVELLKRYGASGSVLKAALIKRALLAEDEPITSISQPQSLCLSAAKIQRDEKMVIASVFDQIRAASWDGTVKVVAVEFLSPPYTEQQKIRVSCRVRIFNGVESVIDTAVIRAP